MSSHKNFVATNLSFFVAPEKCRDINFFVTTNIFSFSSSTLSRHFVLYCDNLYGVLLYFVVTIISFVVIEFFTVVCCCCYDRPFLSGDIVLLSYTTETELCVAINFEDVAIYILL